MAVFFDGRCACGREVCDFTCLIYAAYMCKQNIIDTWQEHMKTGTSFCTKEPSYCPQATPPDVRPVVRGRWIKPTRVPDSMLSECSACGFDTGAYTFNFCPNCGADMREPPKEET